MQITEIGSRTQGLSTIKNVRKMQDGNGDSFKQYMDRTNSKDENGKEVLSERKESGETVKNMMKKGKADSVSKPEEKFQEAFTVEGNEALEKAAEQMVQAVSAVLMQNPETVFLKMEEMGMQAADLLNPEGLMKLALALTDGADEMSLLTDAQLYSEVKSLTETLAEVLKNIEAESGIMPQVTKPEDVAVYEVVIQQEEPEIPEIIMGQQNLLHAQEGNSKQDTLTAQAEEPVNAQILTGQTKEAEPDEKSGERGKRDFDESRTFDPNLAVAGRKDTSEPGTEAVRTFRDNLPDTREIMNQVLDYMKVQVKPGITHLEMQLHPESLGNLHINISYKEGLMTAQFIARSEDVKAVLESQMVELRQNLEQQGLKVEAVNVTVAEYSLNGGSSYQSEQEEKQSDGRKKSGRALRLSDITSEEELEEEDSLAVEMMKQNGGTVDFTA